MSQIIDTPDGIRFFQLLSLRGRLRLEIETGMPFSSRLSTLKAAQQGFGVVARRKPAALAEIEDMIEGAYAWKRGEPITSEHGAAWERGYRFVGGAK